MSKVKIELNLAGVNALMKSQEVRDALEEAGKAVAAEAGALAGGAEFGVRTHLANWVAVTNVFPASEEAARANRQDNVLLHAVGAVGLPTRKKQ